MSSSVRYYLNCPYEEKDQAKSLGARWDKQKHQWYVPNDKFASIDNFNRWCPNGKVFLQCSFRDDHLARSAGAQWDKVAGRWCVPTQTGEIPVRFHRWLPDRLSSYGNVADGGHYGQPRSVVHNVDDSSEEEDNYMFSYVTATYPEDFCSSQEASTSPSSSPKKRNAKGCAKDATTLRISEAMTVPQLQQECKFRGIKGFSGKAKGWLLNELEVGSIWQVHRQEYVSAKAAKNASTMKKEEPSNKTVKFVTKGGTTASSSDHRKAPTAKKACKSSIKEKVSSTTRAPVPATVNPKGKSPKKLPPKLAIRPPSSKQLMNLPRVTSALTIAQLSYELMNRHPQTKGTSSKPKAWFISLLGENSIWTTSADLPISIKYARQVSKDLTVQELKHEIMTRLPNTKGLSKKTKAELLQLTGEGSIWITHDHDNE